MKNEQIIDSYYKEAVKGLNDIILDDNDLWYSYIINLPMHLQVVYTTVVFHQQISNGGLHQYFFNSYGQFAYVTAENLNLIKAYSAAKILEKALIEVNIEGCSESEFREKIFNRELNKIADFDDKLYDYLETLDSEYESTNEDLEQLILEYLQGS